MAHEVYMEPPVLVYSPPVNEETSKWGVYSIPKMWREPDGTLVIRFNGIEDNGLTKQCVPDLYFISKDDGNTWEQDVDGKEHYDETVLSGINPPYLKLKSGDIIAISFEKDCKPIENIPFEKEFIVPNGDSVIHTYQYGNVPADCKGVKLIKIRNGQKNVYDIKYDFPEREILVNAKGLDRDKNVFVPVPEYVQSNFFWSSYMNGPVEMPDGTLLAIAHGQNPTISDRQCEEVYLVVSDDQGRTWKKRSTIASDVDEYPHGYGGDGGEISLTRATGGNLVCAMRMEMSTPEGFGDTMIAISKDNGFTWSKPFSASDSSVTPHVVALEDNIVLLIYGRPGVHFKVSEDGGETWGEAHTLIGKTLTEERRAGRRDCDSKYFDSDSYSNTFVEKLSENAILVIYNDLKHLEDDGKLHKAAFVRKISVRCK